MRDRTAALLLAGAASAGSAAIGAAVATLLAHDADSRVNARVDKAYQAMAGAFFTMPRPGADQPAAERPAAERPRLVVLQGDGR